MSSRRAKNIRMRNKREKWESEVKARGLDFLKKEQTRRAEERRRREESANARKEAASKKTERAKQKPAKSQKDTNVKRSRRGRRYNAARGIQKEA